MHSKTQYLAAALLWDTLMSEKYAGISVTFFVNLLFGQGKSIGVPDNFYEHAGTHDDGDQLFQAQIRHLMDNAARERNVQIRGADEFQLIGDSKRGTSPLVGASQMPFPYQIEGKGYVFTLQMTGQRLLFEVTLDAMFLAASERTLFKLQLDRDRMSSTPEGFYVTKFQMSDRGHQFHDQIVKILDGLVAKGSTFEFQQLLRRWEQMVRSMGQKTLKLNIPPSDAAHGTITIG